MSLFLTEQEVAELTGKQRHRAQVRALARMRIECHVRPDGRPIVSRLVFAQTMGNGTKEAEPDFEALNG
jgi:hypothetical protein